MTSPITTLDPVTTSLTTKTILAKEGFACSLLTLAPGEHVRFRYRIVVHQGAARAKIDEIHQDYARTKASGSAAAIVMASSLSMETVM